MMKPEKMEKIRVIGIREDIEKVIKGLHELGCIQIEDLSANISKYNGLISPDSPLEKFRAISEELVKLRGAESLLKPVDGEYVEVEAEKALELAKKINIEEIGKLTNQLKKCEENEAKLKEVYLTLSYLAKFNINFSSFDNPLLSVFIGKIGKKEAEAVEEEIKKKTKNFEICAKELNKYEKVIILIIEKEWGAEVIGMLNGFGFIPFDLPKFTGKPSEELKKVEREIMEVKEEKERIEDEINKFSKKNYQLVVSLRKALEIEGERAEVTARFGKTQSLFVIEGWVRERELEKIKKSLLEITGGRILLEKIKTNEIPPTSLKNPNYLEPFEKFVTFFSIPNSKEVDPTAFFALTFPIIYGMMLGDIAYGLAVLLLGIIGYKKTKGELQYLSSALIPCGLMSIFFGAIFGEILGFEFPSLVNRLKDVSTLLLICIVFGAVHLGLGLLLGMMKEIEHHNVKHALAKFGWIVMELGAGVYFLTSFQTLALFLLLLSVIFIFLGEGVIGIIEIPKLAGNIFSYTRIFAIGLASIALALVINSIKPDPSAGIIFIFTLLIFIFGHVVNIILGIFEPVIQGARLHYVEFFSKFYDGDGVEFTPFGRR